MTRTPARIEAPNPGSPARVRAINLDLIKALARARGVTGAGNIADLLGCDYSTYWRTIKGRTHLAAETEHKWAEALGCTRDELYIKPKVTADRS